MTTSSFETENVSYNKEKHTPSALIPLFYTAESPMATSKIYHIFIL